MQPPDPSANPGHVFVVHGDLTRLRCDHWLLPCDERLFVSRSWRYTRTWEDHDLRAQIDAAAMDLPEGWGDEGVRVLPLPDWPEPCRPWPTSVGLGTETPVAWFVEGARQFLEAATAACATTDRQRPLLALPIVGTGFGGARSAAGELLRPLMDLLMTHVARHSVDVALVAFDARDFSAAQAARRAHAQRSGDPWSRLLGETLCAQADRLAAAAVQGRLVVFMGAGIGAGAGLPTWGALLEALAVRAGLSEAEREGLGRLGYLDRAQVVDRRLGDEHVGAAVSEELARYQNYGLSHALLAGLPVSELITTNYDALFEKASAVVGRPVAVLPYAPTAERSRWLLKMHGCVRNPEDIVLTREHYLRYGAKNAALEGIVQAMLITRQMLYVGFSLDDDNFHRIIDAVRRAVRSSDRRLGTVVTLTHDRLVEQLWGEDLEWVHLTEDAPKAEAARRFDIWLDRLSASAASTRHLLDERFAGVLTAEERLLSEELAQLQALVLSHPDASSPAWGVLREALAKLGAEEG